MPDPISTDDLYGPSNRPSPEEQSAPLPAPVSTIPIEETPEIPMQGPKSPLPPKHRGSFWSNLGAFFIFIGLFGVGVWLSSYLRQYLPNGLVGMTPAQQEVASAPTPTPTPVDPLALWKTYPVVSNATKTPVSGISFKLPPDVLAPICDTTTCLSQGTYLTGGTRFTVAPRGAGQGLIDFRGSAITDAAGTFFTTKEATVGGHRALSFAGAFAGKTVGGYGFTQMRGYMIEVTPTLSLEMNHFTPTGVIADFAADDALFEKIVGTLALPAASIIPIATSASNPATTSGF